MFLSKVDQMKADRDRQQIGDRDVGGQAGLAKPPVTGRKRPQDAGARAAFLLSKSWQTNVMIARWLGLRTRRESLTCSDAAD